VIYIVKLSLWFNWAPRHEGALEEWRYSFTHSLASALDGREWSASRTGLFTAREWALRTLWIGGWVGSRAVLDAVVKIKIPRPIRESNPRTPIIEPVAQRYTDWAIMALHWGSRISKLAVEINFNVKIPTATWRGSWNDEVKKDAGSEVSYHSNRICISWNVLSHKCKMLMNTEATRALFGNKHVNFWVPVTKLTLTHLKVFYLYSSNT
jgi:hypothetical protein